MLLPIAMLAKTSATVVGWVDYANIDSCKLGTGGLRPMNKFAQVELMAIPLPVVRQVRRHQLGARAVLMSLGSVYWADGPGNVAFKPGDVDMKWPDPPEGLRNKLCDIVGGLAAGATSVLADVVNLIAEKLGSGAKYSASMRSTDGFNTSAGM